jgi:predicted molibdopterin-dependent oxidoreductase YjgC
VTDRTLRERSAAEPGGTGRIHNVAAWRSAALRISVDGVAIEARQGQSVLTAILQNAGKIRDLEFNGEPRAGFCLMGACCDCWVWIDGHSGARACREPVRDGMVVSTRASDFPRPGQP